jgi:hypothetical protein
MARQDDMVQVRLLDAHWRWAENNACQAVRSGGVWLDVRAIDRNFPKN